MASKIFHCEKCDCDLLVKNKIKHLSSKRHLANVNRQVEESEDDSDKKKCCKCHQKKELDLFRDDNSTCNQCLDYRNEYRKNNPEKTAEWRKTYFQKIKDEVYTCPICEYDIKKYKKWQHEKGVGHKYLLELKERGEQPEKPERISIDENGKEWHECGTCKLKMLKCEWASHLLCNYHLKCKTEN